MKPVNVKDNTNIGFYKQIHNKDPKFKVGADVRISKQKNIFAKVFTSNWSEEFFVIKKIKNTLPWIYISGDLNSEENWSDFL